MNSNSDIYQTPKNKPNTYSTNAPKKTVTRKINTSNPPVRKLESIFEKSLETKNTTSTKPL
jgi:hypothetical protein